MPSEVPPEAPRRSVYPCEGATLDRWNEEATYQADWSHRARLAVQLLRGERWICDVGCGKQDLRKFLPSGSIYLPADLVKWTPDTAYCELNKGIYPRGYLMMSDVCFVLGVIEYIWWPDQIFVELAKWTESVVFSYNVVDLLALNRSEFWVNTLSVSDLHRFAETAGFAVSDERQFSDGKQVLVRADQKFGNRRRCLRSLVRMTYRRR